MLIRFAWRYFISKKSIQAVTIIAWVTGISIAVGTAALIIVLSIFNGFESLVKDLYSTFHPDLRITSAKTVWMHPDSGKLKRIEQLKGVAAVSYVLESNVHLLYQGARTNAVIKGVDENYPKVSGVAKSIRAGNYLLGTPEQPGLILGSGVEFQLGLHSDRSIEPVTAYLPKKTSKHVSPGDAVSVLNLFPRGSFSIQQDFDNRYVFTNIEVLQHMLGADRQTYSAVELKLSDPAMETAVMQQINQILGTAYLVENRYQQNRSLFAVMQLEKWMIYAILSLILVLAAFTMIGALTMLVLEKQQDIQILKAMGARTSQIFRIFLTEGLLLALSGGIAGALMASLFCYLQVTFKLIPLQGAFVIDYYPVKMMISDIVLVFATLTVIALLASWYPSFRAAQKNLTLKAR